MTSSAVITIGIDPEIHLGPVMLSWHGLTIAAGILVGGLAAAVWLRQRGLPTEPLYTCAIVVTVGALVGSRVLLALYVWRARLSGLYLDAIAAGLPLGVAVGRIGDVINGEHYGAQSDFFLAVRNSHPDALTPNPELAYQSGGLYEVLLGLLIFAVVWPLRHRFRRPGDPAWLVLGLFAAGRFFELFIRVDSPKLALGLNNAQWTSIAILAIVIAGWALTRRGRAAQPGTGLSPPREVAEG